MLKILIIEDDHLCYLALESVLTGHEIHWVKDSKSAIRMLESHHYDWALIDVDLEQKGVGLEVCKLATLKNIYATIVSGHRKREFVEKALVCGAREILSKPFNPSEFKQLLLAREQASSELGPELKRYLNKATKQKAALYNEILTGVSQGLPILLTGESGTGKTRLARLLHDSLIGAEKPFIHVNCAEIPDELAESMLFGHEKGAFSGADSSRRGLIELAHNGTLFLDEVVTLSARVQAKLLKVIEEKSYRVLGSERESYANFQLMSATCESFEETSFRKDLFYRLSGVNINLLALHETRGLSLQIAEEFLEQSSRRMILCEEARTYIAQIKLAGNVRELLTGLKKLKSAGKILIKKEDLEALFGQNHSRAQAKSFKAQVSAFEREIIERVFKSCGENVRKTLKELEITSSTFYRVMNLPSTVI